MFGIGAALVVAAAVVLTVTIGGVAVGLIGSIAVGAAKGALNDCETIFSGFFIVLISVLLFTPWPFLLIE